MNIASHTNNQYNQDYIKGMKILLQISHEKQFNVRKYTWIPLFSKYLSNEGLCEKFWANAQNQNIIGNITKFKFYHPCEERRSLGELINSLLVWSRTKEGGDFWHMICKKYLKQPTLII